MLTSLSIIETSHMPFAEDNNKDVDDFEDARFPKFNKAQQSSTSCAHLIETECLKNQQFLKGAATNLGAGALPFRASLDSTT